jgi:hypothetical protein
LTSSPVFSRSDAATDSETFYSSIFDLFHDPEEQGEVKDLLVWWNRFVPLALPALSFSLIDHRSSLIQAGLPKPCNATLCLKEQYPR